MNRIRTIALVVTFVAAACSGSGGPASCTEFAGDVREMINRDASGDEMMRFIEDTEEQVARLIAADPERAGPCVEAALEALFVAGFAELEDMLGN